MKSYLIRRCGAKPDWSAVPVLSVCEQQETPFTDVKAFGQIARSPDALHVRLWAYERSIRAVGKGSLAASPCEDSCLEFFFCPLPDSKAYFNIEFNPNGAMFLGVGTGLHDLVRLVPDYTDRLFSPAVTRFEGGWAIEYAIPFAFIRRFFPAFSAESGTVIRANCYKCGDLTVHPHYLQWNLTKHRPFTFHWPEEFGQMRFE